MVVENCFSILLDNMQVCIFTEIDNVIKSMNSIAY